MHSATLQLIKLIEIETRHASGSPSWRVVEVALLDIRDAWEGAKVMKPSIQRRRPIDRRQEREEPALLSSRGVEARAASLVEREGIVAEFFGLMQQKRNRCVA
jgi:hypothetical protein